MSDFWKDAPAEKYMQGFTLTNYKDDIYAFSAIIAGTNSLVVAKMKLTNITASKLFNISDMESANDFYLEPKKTFGSVLL